MAASRAARSVIVVKQGMTPCDAAVTPLRAGLERTVTTPPPKPTFLPDSGIGIFDQHAGSTSTAPCFCLSADNVRRTILDYRGGASSATVEVDVLGGCAEAVDRVYGHGLAPDQLATLAHPGTDRGKRLHPLPLRAIPLDILHRLG